MPIVSPDGRRFVETLGVDDDGSACRDQEAIDSFLYSRGLGKREPWTSVLDKQKKRKSRHDDKWNTYTQEGYCEGSPDKSCEGMCLPF